MAKQKKVITTVTPQKIDQKLPDEVGGVLRSLGIKERRAYATELRKAGWTLQSIANEINLTREIVRQYATHPSNNESEVRNAIADLPIPPIPLRSVTKEVSEPMPIPDDVLLQLKELHKEATKVRSSSQKYRKEAEQFTRLVNEQTLNGVSIYSMAKALGITTAGLYARLVRYGYRNTEGKSVAYRTMKHRVTETE